LQIFSDVTGNDIDRCPCCKKGTMITVEVLLPLHSIRDGP